MKMFYNIIIVFTVNVMCPCWRVRDGSGWKKLGFTV